MFRNIICFFSYILNLLAFRLFLLSSDLCSCEFKRRKKVRTIYFPIPLFWGAILCPFSPIDWSAILCPFFLSPLMVRTSPSNKYRPAGKFSSIALIKKTQASLVNHRPGGRKPICLFHLHHSIESYPRPTLCQDRLEPPMLPVPKQLPKLSVPSNVPEAIRALLCCPLAGLGGL